MSQYTDVHGDGPGGDRAGSRPRAGPCARAARVLAGVAPVIAACSTGGTPGTIPVAHPPPPADPPPIEVAAVEFTGAEALDSGILRGAIETRPTVCASPLFLPACLLSDWDWAHDRAWLDPDDVAEDRDRLELVYESWGFPDARVGVSYDTATRTVLRFTIDEGAPLRVASVEVRQLDAVDPPINLPSRLPLQPGDRYALPRLAMIEEWLLDRLAERGHPFGQIEIGGDLDEGERSARLVLTVEPGPPAVFGPARVQAGDPIDDDVIRSMLRFEPGRPYSLARLRETERALYELPVVQRVVVQPEVPAPPDRATPSAPVTVPVVVRVVPRKTRGIELESTLTSTECLTAAGYWRDRYFLGGPRLFGIGVGATSVGAHALDGGFPCSSAGTGAYARPQLFAEARLRQPWPGAPRTQLEIGASTSRSATPGVYILESHTLTLGVSRELGHGLLGMARYAPARNTLDASAAYFCGSYGVCDEAGVGALAGPSWLAPLEATVSWAVGVEPRQTVAPSELEALALWGPLGWRAWARAGIEGAGRWSGSDWRYGRAIAELSLTQPLGVRTELAGHVRAGGITGSDVLPPLVRLYGGGLYSVRGLAQNMLGPAILVTSAATAAELGCAPTCPSGLAIGPEPVAVRPTGGDALGEASLEARWWAADRLQLAAFVDFGALHRGPLELAQAGAGAAAPDPVIAGGWTSRVTPGIGVRVLSNLGPIRLDIAYDAAGSRQRPLFAADDGSLDFRGVVRLDPFTYDDPPVLTEILRRLQVHVGIGQPF